MSGGNTSGGVAMFTPISLYGIFGFWRCRLSLIFFENERMAKFFLEARVGVEPTNSGFADHRLGPLGYRASVCYAQNLCPKLCPSRPFSAYLPPFSFS